MKDFLYEILRWAYKFGPDFELLLACNAYKEASKSRKTKNVMDQRVKDLEILVPLVQKAFTEPQPNPGFEVINAIMKQTISVDVDDVHLLNPPPPNTRAKQLKELKTTFQHSTAMRVLAFIWSRQGRHVDYIDVKDTRSHARMAGEVAEGMMKVWFDQRRLYKWMNQCTAVDEARKAFQSIFKKRHIHFADLYPCPIFQPSTLSNTVDEMITTRADNQLWHDWESDIKVMAKAVRTLLKQAKDAGLSINRARILQVYKELVMVSFITFDNIAERGC